MKKFDFGTWLKEKREERGILAKDLAKKAGITDVSISRYERGSRIPNVKVAMDICKALNLDSVRPEDFEYLSDDDSETA